MSLPDIAHLQIAIFLALMVGGIGFAGIWGGAPERFGALTLIGMTAIQATLYNTIGSPEYDAIDWVAFAADLFGFAALTAIALTADRFWPILGASLQLISMVAHFMRGITEMLGISYAHLKSTQTLFVIVALIIGTALHLIRKRLQGHDRSWFPHRRYSEFRAIADRAEL